MSLTVAVLGAGAAGMMAALAASEKPGNKIILLERQSRVGRKLAVTGNGRCNLTNLNCSPEHYHGESPEFVRPALESFSVKQTLEFFKGLGLLTVAEENGRVYPYSDQAGSVVDVLRFALDRQGVELRSGFEVQRVRREKGGFALVSDSGSVFAHRLIVAGGGIAGGKAGGCSGGYDALKALGHSCTKLYPALVQLKTDNTWTRSLKGVRADAQVTVLQRGQAVAQSRGEVQFTDYGVSGPAIFDVSRSASRGDGLTVKLDLMSLLTERELAEMLARRIEGYPRLTVENLLTGMVQNRLGRVAAQRCGLPLTTPLSEVSGREIEKVARCLKDFRLEVKGTMGMDNAQVTAGGVRTGEFDPYTMESRLVPGLFACGEVLDVDGDCGGYNLQWAWSSGYVAGFSAVK